MGIVAGAVGVIWMVRNPWMQRRLIYLSIIKPPLWLVPLDYSKEGFHRSLRITSHDNEELGAWVYNEFDQEDTNRVVLYLHGNGGTRGQVGFTGIGRGRMLIGWNVVP